MMEELNPLLASLQIECSEDQLKQFEIFYRLLLEWNEKMNLTAITEEKEVIVKHFYDSLTAVLVQSFQSQKVIDIGAGAGFPSIPLKICFPQLEMTLLDSLNKRITFLTIVGKELGFKNYTAVHGRAEELAKKVEFREKYDIGIARAVARLNILTELTLPFINKEGKMIAMKGSSAKEEIAEASKAIDLLGGKYSRAEFLSLPFDYGERSIILIDKIKSTPKKYPRKPGTPNREPII